MHISPLAGAVATVLLSLAGPALAAPAVTLTEAGFAAGPGKDYDITRKLAGGSHVDVIWCGTHENWCLVDFHNRRGWVPMASLTFKVPHAVNLDGSGGSSNGDAPIATGGGGGGGGKAAALATETRVGGSGPNIHLTPNIIGKINP
jgi:hypothetical protein